MLSLGILTDVSHNMTLFQQRSNPKKKDVNTFVFISVYNSPHWSILSISFAVIQYEILISRKITRQIKH